MGRSAWSGSPDGLNGALGILDVDFKATIGASGAPTLTQGAEWFTLVRASAGLYTLAFSAGAVKELRHAKIEVQGVTALTGGLRAWVTQDHAATGGAAQIQFTTTGQADVTATDPTSGNAITGFLRLRLW